MSKICTILNDLKEIELLNDLVDAFIIPIKDFSINYGNYFKIEDVKRIKTDKEIFLSLNRNIHNEELDDLKEVLISLNDLNIKGVIFYDIAFINLKKKLNLNYDLVWSQEHLTTNYMTVNYWHEKGAKYAYLSSEITKKEIDEITQNTNSKLFLNVFGFIPMFTSRRHLVNSYLETFDLNKDNEYYLYKEKKTYPIVDMEYGTTVYSNYILNSFDEVKEFNIDYLVFNPFKIEFDEYVNVLKSVKEGVKIQMPKELGFLDKETIYKVKKND